MTLKQKYIRTKDDKIIVFPELLQHSEFKKFEPVSAGFISIKVKVHGGNGYAQTDCMCYGESVSLKLKANEIEDTKLARRQILGYEPE